VTRLDIFLEGDAFDRERVERALAANGIAGDGDTIETADGGFADITVEDDSVGFLVGTLSAEIASIVFDVARRTGLAILPVDGTPAAIVTADDAEPPEDLEPVRASTAADVFEALQLSVARRKEIRGAHQA